jgi:hypothetical protein
MKDAKDGLGNLLCDMMLWDEMRYMMRCNLLTPGSPKYIPPVTLSISAMPDPCIPLLPSLPPSSLNLPTPALVQSSAKLSGGGGGGKQIFPQHLLPGPLSEGHLTTAV